MTKILHKRSSTIGSAPTTASIDLGELAINTTDGKLFLKKSGSVGESIEQAIITGASNQGTVNLTGSLILSATGSVGTNSALDVSVQTLDFDFDTLAFNGTSSFAGPFTVTSSVILSGSLTTIGNTVLSGSLDVQSGITGSLFGTSSWAANASTASFAPNYVLTSVTSSMLAPYVLTSQTSSMSVASASVATSASYALTASFALNGGGGAAFPYTGSAIISGSLEVTGSANVQGAIGISQALIERAEITISASGLYTVYSAPTSSYRGIFADYTLISTNPAGNARAGNIMSVLSGSQVRYTETRTSDIGSTTGVTVQASLNGGNLDLELNVATVTTTWNLVSLVRTI